MSASLTCPNCNSCELESDAARGDTVCTRCGSVLETNLIVSEVQFEEGANGANHTVGQRVHSESLFRGLSVGGFLGSSKESREITLRNAKQKVKEVGAQLRLNNLCVETAFNFYKMALTRRLTHGRKHSHVIAACVYLACRVEATPHLLLDLSDLMQVNVYDLGRTYLKLSSALCIKLPEIDPSLYIVRFAHRLFSLHERTHDIEMTANRLVQRMKRDWMHFGRRPSGLCGAALLVAARLHDVHCTVKDVIKVVKVCETTIRKRLNEFGDTPSSRLTLDEFMTVELEGEEDPPCYKAARRKQKQLQLETHHKLEEVSEDEINRLEQLIEKGLEKSRKKLRGPWAKLSLDNPATPALEENLDENTETERFVVEKTFETVNELIQDEVESENESYINQIKNLRPTAASLGLTDDIRSCLNDSTSETENWDIALNNAVEPIDSGELDLNDLDEEELNTYILSPGEIVAKTNIWMKIHAEYLTELAEKEKRKAEEEEERRRREADGEIAPKKKRRTRKKQPIQANTAGEAIEKMLQEKRISNKINYDVLKRLSEPITSNRTNVVNTETNINTSSNENENTSSSSLKRLPSMRTSISNSVKLPLIKRQKKSIDDSISVTNEESQQSNANNRGESSSIKNLEIINYEEEDAEAEDYEEELEPNVGESHLSITQLMSQHHGLNDGMDMYDEDDDGYD